MTSRTASTHSLIPHPESRRGAVSAIDVSVSWPSWDHLEVAYRLVADLSALRMPEPRPPVRSDGLWRHSCFEAFIARDTGTDYWEFNFSPSSAWAAYHFTAYREGMAPLMKGAPPDIHQSISTGEFTLTARVDLSWLMKSVGDAPLRLGLSAVVEDRDRVLSYWALAHPREKPDFHDAGGRVVALD